MNTKFYRKKKFWVSVVGVLTAAGLVSASQSDALVQLMMAFIGG
jgi:hypothetical protein